ncbi:hypothetical protein [Paractinoplanes lichenicola]|uniref:hypothetical protein n=1 Tax=Paractinoplanes lichenicola TaxID=2802976 RepID=UPI0027DB4D23|nr:hypothetical protein [Actinoplanes lichenicola]
MTKPSNIDTGCVHGPAWYVRRLVARLHDVAALSPSAPLASMLAEGIDRVRPDHDGACDLANPATPAATVCLVRAIGSTLDYLILSDCTLVIDQGDSVTALTDERFARVIARLRQRALADGTVTGPIVGQTPGKYALTNQPDGYWIAGATPAAAHEAVTGTLPLHGSDRVRQAALLTDGTSCAVDPYQLLDWRQLIDVLVDDGPHELIRRVRQAENGDPAADRYPRYKRHDDATAALCLFEETP